MVLIKKAFILFSIIIVLSTSVVYKPIETDAVTKVVWNFITQKSAKQSISFLVEKKAKQTILDNAKRELPSQLARQYRVKKNHRLIRKNSDELSPVYNAKNVNSWTKADNKKLSKAIEENIEKRINFGQKFSLHDDIVNFFTNYDLVMGAGALLTIKLSGTSKEELEKLAFNSLVDAGLLSKAITVHQTREYLSFEKKEYDFSLFDEREKIREETDLELNNVVEMGNILDNDLDDSPWDYRDILDEAYNFNNSDTSMMGKTMIIDFNNWEHFQEKNELYNLWFQFRENWTNWTYFNFSYNGTDENNRSAFISSFGNALTDRYGSDRDFYLNGEIWNGGNTFNVWQDENFTNEDEIFSPFLTLKQLIIKMPNHANDHFVITLKGDDGVIKMIEPLIDFDENFNLTDFDLRIESSIEDQTTINNLDLDISIYNTDREDVYSNEKLPTNHGDLDVSQTEFENDTGDQISIPNITEIPMTTPNGTEIEVAPNPSDDDFIIRDKSTGEEIELNEEEATGINTSNPTTTPNDDDIGTPDVQQPAPNPNPNPGDGDGGGGGGDGDAPSCTVNKDFDGFKELGEDFTTKFPFSIPFDLYNMFESLFGDMGSQKPEWEYPLFNTTITIKIPDFFDNWIPFARGLLLIIFDIGLMFAVRKMMGGNQG